MFGIIIAVCLATQEAPKCRGFFYDAHKIQSLEECRGLAKQMATRISLELKSRNIYTRITYACVKRGEYV